MTKAPDSQTGAVNQGRDDALAGRKADTRNWDYQPRLDYENQHEFTKKSSTSS